MVERKPLSDAYRTICLLSLEKCKNDDDYERGHSDADDLLVEILRKLGEDEIADAYDAINPKHCA